MQRFSHVLAILIMIFVVISISACENGDPSFSNSNIVYQAGMAWDPPNYGDSPIPVWWKGEDTPTRLPMLTYAGDCPPSGSVEGMTVVNGRVVMVGISSICIEDNQNMKPVIWQDGIVTQLAFPDNKHFLGTAMDVASENDVLYIVGATGILSPLPVLWVDGFPINLPLPDDYDSGEAQKIYIQGDDIYVSAILSRDGAGTLEWATGYWKMDTSLGNADWTFLPVPTGAEDKANPPVLVTLAGENVWGIANVYADISQQVKPALSMNGGTPIPLIDFDFDTEPWGEANDLVWDGSSTVAVGYKTVEEQYGYPGPVLWTDTVAEKLSTADPDLGLGEAYAVKTVGGDVYVSGQTLKKDPDDDHVLIAVPAYWINGERHDRQGLATEGNVALGTSTWKDWPAWPSRSTLSGLPQGQFTYGTNAIQSAVAMTMAVVVR